MASPEELGHEVAAAEPEFAIVAAGLEKGPHLPEVLEPQEPSVGLEAVGVEKGRARIGAHRSHLLIRSIALGGRNRLLLLVSRKI